MLGAWLVAVVLAAQASAESYTLYHRFTPGGEYAPRGVVSVDGEGATFAPEAGESKAAGSGDWYQVALDVDGEMITTSTPSCFVDEDAKLVVHLEGSRPSSIEFKAARVPNDGACPSAGTRALPNAAVAVELAVPYKAVSPALHAPPQVDESTGKPKEPEPEKSFFQKYGLYIAIGAFVLMISSGAPPEEGQRAAPARAA